MWDDVKIGKGETGITTILQPDVEIEEVHVSANYVCYRITLTKYKIGATVMKNTAVGKRLVKYQQDRKPKQFREYAEKMILQGIKPSKFATVIDRIAQESFRKGVEYKINEIRKALDIWG